MGTVTKIITHTIVLGAQLIRSSQRSPIYCSQIMKNSDLWLVKYSHANNSYQIVNRQIDSRNYKP